MAETIVSFLLVFILTRSLTTSSDHGKSDFHTRQSPIDIITCRAVEADLPTLYVNSGYIDGNQSFMSNNGHTVEVYLPDDLGCDERPYLQGGPLGDKYCFRHMHFHWGEHNYWGSEHFVNGNSFPAEIHLVYFKCSYNTFDEAKEKGNGLAVIGMPVEECDENMSMDELVGKLPDTTDAGSTVELNTNDWMLWAFSALQDNQEYYTYDGSLTTPPFTQNVKWIFTPHAISLSAQQIQAFRKLNDENGRPILDNKREVQPLRNREVSRSTDLAVSMDII